MKFLAIIPARGGSKGVPRKNVRLLNGRPLIAYTIDAALQSRTIDRTIVSTDDDEIASISRGLGAEVKMRSAELSQDNIPTSDVLRSVVAELAECRYAADAVMTLQPTSPLRTAEHIDEAAARFEADPHADSLVSCIDVPHIFHPLSVMRRTGEGYLAPYSTGAQPFRRQDKEKLFARNGAAVYITRIDRLSEYVFGGRLIPYIMDESSSVDIDTLDDFDRAERIMKALT